MATASAVLALAACGGESDSKGAGAYNANQACTVAMGGPTEFAGAITAWVYGQPETPTPDSGIDASKLFTDDDYQQQLKKLSQTSRDDAAEFRDARKADDDAKLRTLEASGRDTFDEILEICKSKGWTQPDYVTQLRQVYDKQPENAFESTSTPQATTSKSAAPTPVKLTPGGATVKVGDSVTFNYPKPRNGYSTPITLTVTAVEKAPAGSVDLDGEDAAKVKQVFYIRAKGKQARSESSPDAVPMYDVRPEFAVTMSDGAANDLIGRGDSAKCRMKEDTESSEYCFVWGTTSQSGTVSSVELVDVDSASTPAPKFTWKN